MPKTKNIKPTSLFDYVGAIFMMFLFIGGVLIVWNITRKDTSTLAQRTIVECPPTIEDYQDVANNSGQVVELIPKRVSSYGENGMFAKKQIVITKIETEKSKIACGYISIRAGTDKYGSLQSWENVYINPNGFGGHIDSENQIGVGDARDYTEYTFSLNEMLYWKTRADRWRGALSNADWASLLNVSTEVTFVIALNTEEVGGFIDSTSIVYKCWNPKTGEENKDCKIEVDSTIDGVIRDF